MKCFGLDLEKSFAAIGLPVEHASYYYVSLQKTNEYIQSLFYMFKKTLRH